MTARRDMRFDVDVLRSLAGDKVFARGEVYHRDGQVEIFAIETGCVLAQVAGTEDYRTRLTGQGRDIGGECSCPAFDDWGFCKHLVATALAANALDGDGEAEVAGTLRRIRDHLKKQSVDALVDMIMALAERDMVLLRKLDGAAGLAGADDKMLGLRLRKAVDQATRTGGYVDYRAVPNWVAEVDAVLDSIDQLAAAGRGVLALELVERAIGRIEHAIKAIDDSDGYCGRLLERCGDIYCAAVHAAKPAPVCLARDLFDREMKGEYGIFAGAGERYAEALGDAGLAEYRRLATHAWAKLPLRMGRTTEHEPSGGNYRQLMAILDAFAERDGDIEARIALRAKDLSSPWAYLQLAEFCLAQGREDEALRQAREGVWLFEDSRPDERLISFTADLLARADQAEEAEALLQRAFGKAPTLTLYTRLRAFGERARNQAIAFLQAQAAREKPSRWHSPADLLIQALVQEGAFEQAWAAVRSYGASDGAKAKLARASETSHPREAVGVYAERVDHLVAGGGNPAYAEAAELIVRMAGLRSATEQHDHVQALKARFGRKRNFLKLLG